MPKAAGRADGSVVVVSRFDTDGITSGFKQVGATCQATAGKIASLGSVIKKVGALFAVGSIVKFGKEALELGSDLAEVQNVVDTVFPNMSSRVDEFSKNAMASFGLSETMAKQFTGTFGAMADAFGFTEQESYDMSTALTGLAGDVASFYNISQDLAYTKLKSVFSGETETLKDLGIVMTQSALDSYALANGLGKTTSKMTEQEKVSLRYKFILDQLSNASGDFSRTSEGWANQTRMLKLNMQSFMATVGQGLINIFTPVIKTLNTVFASLQRVAEGFKAFTELLTGNKAQSSNTGAIANEYSAMANEAENIASGMEDVTEATKAAEKANKKYLSGLDEMRIYDNSASSGTNGTDVSGGLANIPAQSIDFGKAAEGDTIFGRMAEKLTVIVDKLRELGEMFAKGFNLGFGNSFSTLDKLKENFKKLGTILKDIFTDSDIVKSFSKLIDSLALTLGTWIGSLFSVGLSIANLLIGGITQYLAQNKDTVKNHILKMFQIGTEISDTLRRWFSTIGEILSEVFNSGLALGIITNIISIFSTIGMTILEVLGGLFSDVLGIITAPIVENKDAIVDTILGILEPIESVSATLKEFAEKVSAGIKSIYKENLKPFLDDIKTGITEIVDKTLKAWNEHIKPVLDKLAARFKEIMDGPVGNAFDKFVGFIKTAIEWMQMLWNNVLQPIIKWIVTTIIERLAPVINFIGNAFMTVFAGISEALGGFFDMCKGVLNFVMDIFKGDWEAAWEDVKSIFKGIWDTFKSIITTPINLVIDGINFLIEQVANGMNAVIRAINKISFDLPDFLGGGHVGFDLNEITPPQIPYLASGAAIPPNAPFAAVLGDQKRGYNIEAPEGLIRKIFNEELDKRGNGNSGVINLTLDLDGNVVFKRIIEIGKNQQRMTGLDPFALA